MCGDWICIFSGKDAEYVDSIFMSFRIGRDFGGTTNVLAAPLASGTPSPGAADRPHGGFGFQLRAEAVLLSLTEEVLKSSEIEGERLDREQGVLNRTTAGDRYSGARADGPQRRRGR